MISVITGMLGVRSEEPFGGSLSWTVLVVDEVGRHVLASLLSRSDTRKCGVTLLLDINKQRDTVPGVPAVYFISPTESNIKQLVADTARGLYSDYRVFFTSPISRPMLELLAREGASRGASAISKVVDTYTHTVVADHTVFMCPEALFTDTSRKLTFSRVYGSVPRLTAPMVAQNLLSTILAAEMSVPYIVAPTGTGVAATAAHALNAAIQDRMKLVWPSSTNVIRPCVAILDRADCLGDALVFPWTYGGLVHDVYGLEGNAVTVPREDLGEGSGVATFTLGAPSDSFWHDNALVYFDVAAEANDEAVTQGKRAVAQASAGIDGAEGAAAAIDSLPELLAAKQQISKHTNILHALTTKIKDLRRDELAVVTNEALASHSGLDGLAEIVTAGARPRSVRLRILALIACILVENDKLTLEALSRGARSSEVSETWPAALRGPFEKLAGEATPSNPNAALETEDVLVGVAQVLSQGLGIRTRDEAVSTSAAPTPPARGMLNKMVARAVSKVSKAFGGRHRAATTVLSALLHQRAPEGYEIIDPTGASDAGRVVPHEVILYTVGGGNYDELSRAKTWAEENMPATTIFYGATSMTTGEDVVSGLREVGRAERQ